MFLEALHTSENFVAVEALGHSVYGFGALA